MPNNRRVRSFAGLLCGLMLSLAGVSSGALSQQVYRAPEGQSLESAWEWAAAAQKEKDLAEVWVGYSIRRMMKQNSWIGSFNSWSTGRETTLVEVLTGKFLEYDANRPGENDLKREARRALDRAKGNDEDVFVEKELAFLFRFETAPGKADGLRRVRMSNIDLHVELEQRPLLWLGTFDQQQSLRFLDRLFRNTDSPKVQEKIVPAIGVHEKNSAAFTLLKEIAGGAYDTDVREDAVFWISQQRTDEALDYLVGLAESGREEKIVERAVFGISQFEAEKATDVLIRLGQAGRSEKLRKRAVFWLGQRASRKVVESLKDFAYNDENTEVQKQAVFALSQINDGGGVDEMIRIATSHPNPKIRKQAVFWLGESDDPRAFDAIVAIAKGK